MSQVDWIVDRKNDVCCNVPNSLGIDVKLFANDQVAIDRDAFQELFNFLDVQRAISDLLSEEKSGSFSFFGDPNVGIKKVVLTPDFHKGSGIPIGTVVENTGFVIPSAIGNDICCGMRLLVTDIPVSKLEPHWEDIQKRLRQIFFQGQRNIPMSPRQREAVLRFGLSGLIETISDNSNTGIYKFFDTRQQIEDLSRTHNNGGFSTDRLFGFEKLIHSSGAIDGRDPQIGSVGGGNHFVEFQKNDEILCKATAREMNISVGNLAIMIHSGSVSLGHAVGWHFVDRARELFPNGIKIPKNDFFILPTIGPLAKEGIFYLNSMRNAANFAFANRLFLGLMAIKAIQEVLGIDVDHRLVYDAPHNLIFEGEDNKFIHRKGATPAEGPDREDRWIGKPVIIPGCFAAGTRILKADGSYENIEKLSVGDKIISGTGNVTRVTGIFERGIKKVLKYKNNNFHSETSVTEDHLHFVSDLSSTPIKNKKRSDSRISIANRLNKDGSKKEKWIQIGECNQNHMLLFPLISLELPDTCVFNFSGVEYSANYDLGYIFGTFLGDGTEYYDKKDGGQVSWSFGVKETNIADKLMMALCSFGFVSKLYSTKNTILVVVHDAEFARFFADFGKRENKKLPSHFMCHNVSYLQGLYDGLIDSDGHVNNNTKKFTNTSTVLIEQFGIIHYMLFGYLPSVGYRKPSVGGLKNYNIDNCKPSYRSTSVCRPLVIDHYQLIEILNFDKEYEFMATFDIEVDDEDHSFIANNVIVHNSMGSASYLLTGLGNQEALESACHGAGRIMPRGEASHVSDKIFDQQTQKLRIVTAVDPRSPQMQMRKDIMAKYKERVKEEAPYAYKPITPVIESIKSAGIARVVSKLLPLCTVKG